MLRNSTQKTRSRKAAIDKPPKPYKDFPLTPHNSGAWMKKINGRIHYFGKWGRRVNGKLERVPGDGWKEALELYKSQADDLHAGRTPRTSTDELTVADLCNHFLTAKHHKLVSGELGPRMFAEYTETTDLLTAAFGKNRRVDDLAADDFERLRADMAERWGTVRLSNAITRIKSVFKYGIDNGLLEKAIRYGSEFKKPGKAVLRKHKAANGKKMLEAGECRKLINGADAQLRAMVLLGLNCGFGNSDCATLPLTVVDLETGWLDYPRPKTGIERRCPLWAETIEALREAIAQRPEPANDDVKDLVFLTSRGTAWLRSTAKAKVDNIAIQFGNLAKRVGVHRPGLGFYTMRHVHRTIADAARDPVACDVIMGHADPTMGGHYRERVDGGRLVAITDHVRQWLFGAGPDDGQTQEEQDTIDLPENEIEQQGPERPVLKLFAG